MCYCIDFCFYFILILKYLGNKKIYIYKYMIVYNIVVVFIIRYYCLVKCFSVRMNDLEFVE